MKPAPTNSAATVPPLERARALAADLRQAWSRGRRKSAEDYLSDFPELRSASDAVVELVYSEFIARVANGERPAANEYRSRFPEHAEPIARQLAVDSLFDELAPHTIAFDAGPPAAGYEPAPDRIGRYLILGPIGTGGQSDVYRALHPDLNKEIVIKLGRDGGPGGPDALRSEAQLLATLDHPGLARVYDLDRTADGRYFCALEYVRGPNLRQYAQSRAIRPDEAAALVAPAARAADYAHRHGVAHLDIKPANIVLDPDGRPRLIDFGLSRVRSGFADDAGAVDSVSGTAAFMAPEQARGEPTGPATDVFGLGGVLYFLLTGTAPFEAKRLAESLALSTAGNWDRTKLKSIPPRIAAICAKALSAAPEDRFPSAAAMADELERPLRPARRRLVVAVGVAAALLVAAAVVQPWRAPVPAPVPPANLDRGAKLTVSAWVGERYEPLPAPAPLRTKQLVRIEATVPADYHAALVSFDAAGKLSLLETFAPRADGQALRFPVDSQRGAPLTGPPGTEVVLLLARRDAISFDDVKAAWGTSGPWPTVPNLSVLQLSGTAVTALQQDRGFGPPHPQRDPETDVGDRLAALGQRLRERFAIVEGVAFRHVE